MESLRQKLLRGEDFSVENDQKKLTAEADTEETSEAHKGTTISVMWQRNWRSDLKYIPAFLSWFFFYITKRCKFHRLHSAVDNTWMGDATRYRLTGRNYEIANNQYLIRLISLFILPDEASKDDTGSFDT